MFLQQNIDTSKQVPFFVCEGCGSCVVSEAQTSGPKRNCIYSGERLPTHDSKGEPLAKTSQVYTTCLVCKFKTKVSSNCVYRNKLAGNRREATLAKERINDPTFAQVVMQCPFSSCPSKSDPTRLNSAVFQKVEEEAFKLLYTCRSCMGSWEA